MEEVPYCDKSKERCSYLEFKKYAHERMVTFDTDAICSEEYDPNKLVFITNVN
jgi:hypothetical protein